MLLVVVRRVEARGALDVAPGLDDGRAGLALRVGHGTAIAGCECRWD